MESAPREPTKTVYLMNPSQGTAQAAAMAPGNVVCLPLSGAGGGFSGRSRKTVYRMAPSQIQGTRVLQPVVNGGGGAKIVAGAKCDACPPNTRIQAYTLDGERLNLAPEPSIVRVVPQGKRIYLEEVKPPQPRSTGRTRQKLPTVMQLVDDGNWYANMAPESESEMEVPAGMEPDACRECLEELLRRRRGAEPEPRGKEPIYVTAVPSSKRSSSRRATSSGGPSRSPSRSPQPTRSPRCLNCTSCKSCGTIGSAATSRSRSRKWYD